MPAKAIVAIVGMPGSGKSGVAKLFSARGYAVVRFGKVTDDELRQRSWPVSERNERKVREGLRRKHGMAAYAKLTLPAIREAIAVGRKVVLDGLYSWEECGFLKKRFPRLVLVAVHAPPAVRHARLSGRSVRPLELEAAVQRDYAELSKLNKAAPIAMADWVIDNSGSMERLRRQVNAVIRNVESAG